MAPEANQAAVPAGSGEIPVPNGTPEVPACVGTVCCMPQCRKTVNGVGGNADHRTGLACGGALVGVLLNQSCLVPTYESYVCALSSGRKCRRVFICVGCADRVSAASQLTNPGGLKQPPKSQVRTMWSQGRPQILCSPLHCKPAWREEKKKSSSVVV